MMHKPIQLTQLSLSFPHKICFEDFDAQIHYGDRIAIIGQNGSGKSTLLNLLRGITPPASGQVIIPADARIGYVPQIITDFPEYSGGERVNQAVTAALRNDPNVLLLDEPTNHLDQHYRKNIMRLLSQFPGTLLVVSHDVAILRHCVDRFWHIDQGRIHIFNGNFDNYSQTRENQQRMIEQELSVLKRQKQTLHHD